MWKAGDSLTQCRKSDKVLSVMDSSWDVCPYCPSPAPRPSAGAPTEASETDRTVPADSSTVLTDGGQDSKRRSGMVGAGDHTELDESRSARKTGQRLDHTVIADHDASRGKEIRKDRALVGWLVTFSHHPDGEDYQLREGRNVIGVEKSCDVVLSDSAVSGTHAVVMYRADEYVIEDQLSTNGSFVNGEDLGPRGVRNLTDGDTLKVGDTTLVFKCFNRPLE
jgi:hypothetical protein